MAETFRVSVQNKNFAEETFVDGSETAENAKVFSLEGSPLYGIRSIHY